MLFYFNIKETPFRARKGVVYPTSRRNTDRAVIERATRRSPMRSVLGSPSPNLVATGGAFSSRSVSLLAPFPPQKTTVVRGIFCLGFRLPTEETNVMADVVSYTIPWEHKATLGTTGYRAAVDMMERGDVHVPPPRVKQNTVFSG